MLSNCLMKMFKILKYTKKIKNAKCSSFEYQTLNKNWYSILLYTRNGFLECLFSLALFFSALVKWDYFFSSHFTHSDHIKTD